jgi:hypothetical protein
VLLPCMLVLTLVLCARHAHTYHLHVPGMHTHITCMQNPARICIQQRSSALLQHQRVCNGLLYLLLLMDTLQMPRSWGCCWRCVSCIAWRAPAASSSH